MTLRQTSNLNIESITPFEPPNAFVKRLPATPAISETVDRSRREISAILTGEDDRMVMLVGPCSIHDEAAGIEFAQRLAGLSEKVQDRIAVVMRVYFEKPRTSTGRSTFRRASRVRAGSCWTWWTWACRRPSSGSTPSRRNTWPT